MRIIEVTKHRFSERKEGSEQEKGQQASVTREQKSRVTVGSLQSSFLTQQEGTL